MQMLLRHTSLSNAPFSSACFKYWSTQIHPQHNGLQYISRVCFYHYQDWFMEMINCIHTFPGVLIQRGFINGDQRLRCLLINDRKITWHLYLDFSQNPECQNITYLHPLWAALFNPPGRKNKVFCEVCWYFRTMWLMFLRIYKYNT